MANVGRWDFAAAAAPRRRLLPLTLLVLTAASTFFVGCTWWAPSDALASFLAMDAMPLRRIVLENWQPGAIYAVCVLLILGSHEMGHFLATVYYRVPASFPFFIPTPFTPIGTMGAVIGMDGRRADRREVFDIGVAGPLAGLVFAIPIMYYGVTQLNLNQQGRGGMMLDLPLMVQWMLAWAGPENMQVSRVWLGHLKGNPYFMAGWFGLLITGLNMMPVGQLDGGHVTYTVFGKHSRWMARLFMFAAAGFVILFNVWIWMLMLILVMMMGIDHPPTRDDRVQLGWFRVALGVVSLVIPLLCFPIRGIVIAS